MRRLDKRGDISGGQADDALREQRRVKQRERRQYYDQLDDDIKAEIPLERIWVVMPTGAP